MNRITPNDSASSVSRATTEAGAPSFNNSLLFIGEGQFTKKTVLFDADNKQVGTLKIRGGKFAVDHQGDFYDVQAYSSKLEIFRPPYKKAPEIINFEPSLAEDVAVDSRTGVFAVTLQYSGSGGVAGVEFFKPGAVQPCAVVDEPSGIYLEAASTFDQEGRLFGVVLLENGDTGIASIDGECSASSLQTYTLPTQQIQPILPPIFNSDDNLVFQDFFTRKIFTYAHPKNGQFGQPLRSTTLTFGRKMALSFPTFRCFAADGKHIWADIDYPTPTVLEEYNYPLGGDPVASITIPNPWSCVAYSANNT